MGEKETRLNGHSFKCLDTKSDVLCRRRLIKFEWNSLSDNLAHLFVNDKISWSKVALSIEFVVYFFLGNRMKNNQ